MWLTPRVVYHELYELKELVIRSHGWWLTPRIYLTQISQIITDFYPQSRIFRLSQIGIRYADVADATDFLQHK